MTTTHYDTIIIGAGLSGIGTACHLMKEHPNRTLAILERRERMGGTWDLYRYPGIRSDSDMTSYGFDFKPWYSDKVLAEGPNIRNYVVETAKEFGFDEKVQYGLAITSANWSDTKQVWTVNATHEATGEKKHLLVLFLSTVRVTTIMTKGTDLTLKVRSRLKVILFTHSFGLKI